METKSTGREGQEQRFENLLQGWGRWKGRVKGEQDRNRYWKIC